MVIQHPAAVEARQARLQCHDVRAVELHRDHPAHADGSGIHRLQRGHRDRPAGQVHDARANDARLGKGGEGGVGFSAGDRRHPARDFAHRGKAGKQVGVVTLMRVRLGDDDAAGAKTAHDTGVIGWAGQALGQRYRAGGGGKAGQIDMCLRVDGALRHGGCRGRAVELAFHHRSFGRNSSSAARSISIPRPGPSGIATMPFTCSIGRVRIA
ncbi:hypothetical protein GALL_523740 [mine drainage metagenome]|uniref:Uncharacterized protein n=1 Tax=mine drainage metagenome TaxID=410659 RepID=A0A1J5PR50_9ZZZZ